MSDPKGETVLTYNQMVVRERADDTVDHLFHALADATRRAPSAGRPPWHVYRLVPRTATALATVEPGGATRWQFPDE